MKSKYLGYDQVRLNVPRDYISYDTQNILLATEMPFPYFLASSFDQYEVRREYSRDFLDCLDSKFKRIALNIIDHSLTFSSCDNKSLVKIADNKGSILISTYFGKTR